MYQEALITITMAAASLPSSFRIINQWLKPPPIIVHASVYSTENIIHSMNITLSVLLIFHPIFFVPYYNIIKSHDYGLKIEFYQHM